MRGSRRERIDRLVLAGQVTEQCILYSALDGYLRHFHVVVPTNAIASINDDLAHAAIKMMETNMDADVAAGVEEVLAASGGDDAVAPWPPGIKGVCPRVCLLGRRRLIDAVAAHHCAGTCVNRVERPARRVSG